MTLEIFLCGNDLPHCKMAPSLAHYKFQTYMKVLEFFFGYNTNLKTKKNYCAINYHSDEG